MNICIVGTGYVGLVTGTCFAEMGNDVWCIDVDNAKIEALKKGRIPIYEPGLKEMVLKNQNEGRLHFSTDIRDGLKKALFCFIAVGTPPLADGSADLTGVMQVAEMIGKTINDYLVVVDKSTVPVGTAEEVRKVIETGLKKRGVNVEFDVISNPEFLKEGAAIEDFMRPDRVVIGADNSHAAELMKQLYQPFVRNQNPILVMDVKSAEITKYAANAMLAARISFMNEISRLCDRLGGDISQVRVGIGSDHRIGMPFLYAGVGYGGSCFPKDVKELISAGNRNGLEMELISAIDRVNQKQKYYMVEMIEKRFGNHLEGKKFGIWGLAFKPQTDDMREAPSVVIINALVKRGAKVVLYDPEAMDQAKIILADCSEQTEFVDNMIEALDDVDALLLVTDWRQFRQIDFEELKQRMRQPIIFDGRNQYNPEQVMANGFEYYCIGRNRYAQ